MKKTLLISSSLVVAGTIAFSTQQSSNANSSGAISGVAGAPMDGGATCTNCHNATATATTGIISSDIPNGGFIAGSTYNFTVTMSGSAAYGFEITPQTATSNAGVGTLIAGTGNKIVSAKYITHNAKKQALRLHGIFNGRLQHLGIQ